MLPINDPNFVKTGKYQQPDFPPQNYRGGGERRGGYNSSNMYPPKDTNPENHTISSRDMIRQPQGANSNLVPANEIYEPRGEYPDQRNNNRKSKNSKNNRVDSGHSRNYDNSNSGHHHHHNNTFNPRNHRADGGGEGNYNKRSNHP